MSRHHLAQLNVGIATAPLDSPIMADFMGNLDRINALAESAPGFVWRLAGDNNNATALRPIDDRTMVNMSVWTDAQSLSAFVFRSLGTMASLGHTRAVARVFGLRLTGFVAWWIRRTYYLFQMPRWDRRLRIVLDWTVALFFRPDITKVELRVEREQVRLAREMADAVNQAGQYGHE